MISPFLDALYDFNVCKGTSSPGIAPLRPMQWRSFTDGGGEWIDPLVSSKPISTGWWFGTCCFSHILGIIPIDELIFFRGVAKNHQPVTVDDIPIETIDVPTSQWLVDSNAGVFTNPYWKNRSMMPMVSQSPAPLFLPIWDIDWNSHGRGWLLEGNHLKSNFIMRGYGIGMSPMMSRPDFGGGEVSHRISDLRGTSKSSILGNMRNNSPSSD